MKRETTVTTIGKSTTVACVTSVSNRVIARKLERELLFFCSRPNFLDELARKRLMSRLQQPLSVSLRSKRFCAVQEQRMSNKSQRPRDKWRK